jgi:hypothetical protein
MGRLLIMSWHVTMPGQRMLCKSWPCAAQQKAVSWHSTDHDAPVPRPCDGRAVEPSAAPGVQPSGHARSAPSARQPVGALPRRSGRLHQRHQLLLRAAGRVRRRHGAPGRAGELAHSRLHARGRGHAAVQQVAGHLHACARAGVVRGPRRAATRAALCRHAGGVRVCCSLCGAAAPSWCDWFTLCGAVCIAVCRCSPGQTNFHLLPSEMLLPSRPTWAHRRAPSPCGSAMASTAGSPPPRALTARATRRAAARLMPCMRSNPASGRSPAAEVHALVPYALRERRPYVWQAPEQGTPAVPQRCTCCAPARLPACLRPSGAPAVSFT